MSKYDWWTAEQLRAELERRDREAAKKQQRMAAVVFASIPRQPNRHDHLWRQQTAARQYAKARMMAKGDR